MKDELNAPTLAETLDTVWLGRTYHYFETAGSTNDVLKRQLANSKPGEPPTGTVILTDYQESGRGRFGRRWDAPSKSSLLFSVLLRPDWAVSKLSWLTMLAGLAVAQTIEQEVKLPTGLKWPNDVVVLHEERWAKVCGILLEGAISVAQQIEHAILGIGINVNIPAERLPAVEQPVTSLALAASRQLPRLPLLAAILASLENEYEAAEGGQSPWRSWNERLITLGRRVAVHRVGRDTTLVGVAEATDEWGQLLVREDGGEVHAVMAADVTLQEAKT